MTIHLTSTDYEPNVPSVPNADANMDTSGARLQERIWHPMESHILARPTSRRSCPQHWPLSPAEGDSVRNVHTPQPIPNQTGLNAWQVKNPQSAQAILGPQETVQLVTQRAREALNAQRETARRALLHQQGEFLAATHQSIRSGCEAKFCQCFGQK